MRPYRATTRRRQTYVVALIAVTLVILLLPRRWTGRAISLVQILVPFQDATRVVADSAAGLVSHDGEVVSRGAYDGLMREKEALVHERAAWAVRVSELEREVSILTATRLWGSDERRIGARGRLIPADIIAEDLLSWRSSRLVNTGTLEGVRDGAPVASREFTIDRGDASGIRDGLSILLGETLIGFIEHTGTHTARVRLITDLESGMRVRIGRFEGDALVSLDRNFWMTGQEGGRLRISDADQRDVEAGRLRPGDLVLSDPASPVLPAAMTIGRITQTEPDRQNPLLSILTVEPAVDLMSLRRVYVFDPSDESGGAQSP